MLTTDFLLLNKIFLLHNHLPLGIQTAYASLLFTHHFYLVFYMKIGLNQTCQPKQPRSFPLYFALPLSSAPYTTFYTVLTPLLSNKAFSIQCKKKCGTVVGVVIKHVFFFFSHSHLLLYMHCNQELQYIYRPECSQLKS